MIFICNNERMTTPPLTTTRVLSLREVRVARGDHTALRDVTATFYAGRLCAVVGPNGSGKSTLLDVAAGLREPQYGSVDRQRGIRIALLAQSTPLPAHLPLTVRDVVTMGTWARLGPWRRRRPADRQIVESALAALELTTLSRRPISALSGGQRQRALLAQALAQRADLVLLDEPMAALDTRSRQIIADTVHQLVASGTAVVAATHDPDEFTAVDDLIELREGRLMP